MRATPPIALFLAVILLALLPSAGQSHHSFAMFDRDRTVTLTGTVQTFEWANPHVWLWLEVTDKQGKVTVWGAEANDPGGMSRIGWSRLTLKTGDKISMDIHPMKDGRPGGSLVSVKMPDGSVKLPGAAPQPPLFKDPKKK